MSAFEDPHLEKAEKVKEKFIEALLSNPAELKAIMEALWRVNVVERDEILYFSWGLNWIRGSSSYGLLIESYHDLKSVFVASALLSDLELLLSDKSLKVLSDE